MQTPLLAARCGSGILKMIPVRFRSTTTTNTLRREAGPAGNFGGKKLRRKEGTLPCGRKQEQLCPGEPSAPVTGHRQRDSFWSPTFFPGQRAWHRNRHRFGWWIGTDHGTGHSYSCSASARFGSVAATSRCQRWERRVSRGPGGNVGALHWCFYILFFLCAKHVYFSDRTETICNLKILKRFVSEPRFELGTFSV
jgi:hypothetical protein